MNGTKQNVAIANPSLGVSVAPPYRDRVTFKNAAVRRRTPTLEDTTITFSLLRLADESTYICEYTTFPAGNRENAVNLTVYGKTYLSEKLNVIKVIRGLFSSQIMEESCLRYNFIIRES